MEKACRTLEVSLYNSRAERNHRTRVPMPIRPTPLSDIALDLGALCQGSSSTKEGELTCGPFEMPTAVAKVVKSAGNDGSVKLALGVHA